MTVHICGECALKHGKRNSVTVVTWPGVCSWCEADTLVAVPTAFNVPEELIRDQEKAAAAR
ncbi:MAG: hypothetical protein HQL52_04995 [Magnetococcales bacterium]|nr:hypothetical protein [Magnetococcales bacterium]